MPARPIKLVRYEGENHHRLATATPPVDAEGKPKKVINRRNASKIEHLAINREIWRQNNEKRGLPRRFVGPGAYPTRQVAAED